MERIFSEAEQGSYEWKLERIPYVTASDVANMMAGGTGATRNNYMVRKLCEMLTGVPVAGYKSSYMQDGNDREHSARLAYQYITDSTVKQLGFCMIPSERLGASTDGEVNEDGIIEIKNVIPAEQVKFITDGKIKGAYIKQMQTQMFVLDKKWCDFVSQSLGDEVNGYLPDQYKIKIVRVYRDDAMIADIRSETIRFWDELEALKQKLTNAQVTRIPA